MELSDYFSILAIVLALSAIVLQFLPLKTKLSKEEYKPFNLTDEEINRLEAAFSVSKKRHKNLIKDAKREEYITDAKGNIKGRVPKDPWPPIKRFRYQCAESFLIEKGWLHPNNKYNRLIKITTNELKSLLEEHARQALREDPSSVCKINTLEAENRHLKDRYEKLLEAHKPLDYENRKIKEELVGLRKLVYLNNENTCQQCSPEHLEAMKEVIKMWVDLAKDLHSRMQDLENKAKDA